MEGAAGPRLSDDGHKLYRIRQTCMKMLDKRGYNVLQEHVSMTSEKFVEDFGTDPKREDMTLLVEKVGGEVEGRGLRMLCIWSVTVYSVLVFLFFRVMCTSP